MLMDFRLYLMTWNVKGRPPIEDLNSALGLADPVDVSNLPDMYAIGLQEVSLNIVSGMFFTEPWHDALKNVLNKWNYIKVKHIRLQGILLMLYCKEEHLTHIRGVQTGLTRTGFGGVWGNKGGVSVRFSAYGCSMCIVNSHLAAHDEEIQQRIEDYNSILDGQKFVDSQTGNIITHDYAFWMGDLNFRIDDYAAAEIQQLVQDNKFGNLMEKDQLKKVMKTGEAFSEFTEHTPKFPPTYKFVVDAKEYDIEARKPAWTDRILYRLTPNVYEHVTLSLQQDHYSSHPQYVQSDHKPVTSSFTVKVFSEPKEHKVQFHFFDKWHVNRDSIAWYTVADEVDIDAWDWIGLYRASFTSVDEHLCYVYASTKSLDKPSDSQTKNKPSDDEGQKQEVLQNTSSAPSTITTTTESTSFASTLTSGSVQAFANSLVRTLTSSPSRSPAASANGSPSQSPARSPATKRRQDDNDKSPCYSWYAVTFADTSLLVPGTYRLLYISSSFDDILGVSNPFQIHS